MNEEKINQILQNQSTIMCVLYDHIQNKDTKTSLKAIEYSMKETVELLNPTKQPSIAERTHDALSKTDEVKE